jgi:hypothetical protein
MACTRLIGPDGQLLGIACSRGQRRPRCSVPGCGRYSTRLCDFRLRTGRTCDARLCDAHRGSASGAPDVDHCPPHRRLAAAQLELEGV